MDCPSYASLDQAELFRLAIDASNRKDAGASISYLKEAVSRVDASALAYFLLGAEYAQIGMIERAVSRMEAAIAMDPGLAVARFQLGLLLLTTSAKDKAVEVLMPLEELGDMHMLSNFGRGLIHLARDEFPEAVHCLHTGIALNTENVTLNIDMQRIIDAVERLPTESKMPRQSGNEEKEDTDAHHLVISTYTENGSTRNS